MGRCYRKTRAGWEYASFALVPAREQQNAFSAGSPLHPGLFTRVSVQAAAIRSSASKIS
jgi:hypothetical protein